MKRRWWDEYNTRCRSESEGDGHVPCCYIKQYQYSCDHLIVDHTHQCRRLHYPEFRTIDVSGTGKCVTCQLDDLEEQLELAEDVLRTAKASGDSEGQRLLELTIVRLKDWIASKVEDRMIEERDIRARQRRARRYYEYNLTLIGKEWDRERKDFNEHRPPHYDPPFMDGDYLDDLDIIPFNEYDPDVEGTCCSGT